MVVGAGVVLGSSVVVGAGVVLGSSVVVGASGASVGGRSLGVVGSTGKKEREMVLFNNTYKDYYQLSWDRQEYTRMDVGRKTYVVVETVPVPR